jgi:hypothetical protein
MDAHPHVANPGVLSKLELAAVAVQVVILQVV